MGSLCSFRAVAWGNNDTNDTLLMRLDQTGLTKRILDDRIEFWARMGVAAPRDIANGKILSMASNSCHCLPWKSKPRKDDHDET